jgi:hypothetical protein
VSVESLTSLLTGGISAMTVMGIFLTLILAGKLHPSGEFDRQSAALDQERQAHGETRKALAEAALRADAAVRASELIAGAMTAASGRRPDAVP